VISDRVMQNRWSAIQGWEAAVTVTAAAYAIEPALLKAPSRGRGPRPPACVWEAKKMAVHLAVLVSGCDYAALGRELGLHRDTVASHCAEMRQRAAEDEYIETASQTLELLVRTTLERKAIGSLVASRAHLALFEEITRELITVMPLPPSSDPHPTAHPTETIDHGNVIKLRPQKPSRPRPL
jgi:hypothetical protein